MSLSVYTASVRAKTGSLVPLFADGKPANSLYNPEREAEKTAARLGLETFAVFAGLADGRRVERFLAASSANECILLEKNRDSFSFLAQFPHVSAVMQSRRARLISLDDNSHDADRQQPSLRALILNSYTPALFRQFSLDILPSWQAHFPKDAEKIREEVEAALTIISADFSAQGLFGKIWHLNAVKNIYNCAKGVNLAASLKNFNRQGKKALVVAAGPSLDKAAAKIKEDRDALALFAADTALPALAKRGIAADFALSIDPQAVSARHFANGLPKGSSGTALIMDICASPAAALRAWKRGCPVLFAAGGHPLSECMASFAPMPRLETSAGTVTASAIDAARRLGFKDVAAAGADFAYTDGKPYCRGTYLEEAYFAECTRLSPAEGMYTALMFRGAVTKEADRGGLITYKTDLLARYKNAVAALQPPASEWGDEIKAAFPYKAFLFFYKDALRKLEANLHIMEENAGSPLFIDNLSKEEKNALFSILPIASYYRRKMPDAERKIILKAAINLALKTVDKYTTKL